MPNARELPRIFPRKDPVYDKEILAAVNSVGGLGNHTDGHYVTFKLHGFNSHAEAKEHGRSVYRCCLYMSRKNLLPGGYGLSASCKVLSNSDGTYSVQASIYDKEHGKKYVDTKYGPNPEDKPYSPHKYFGHKNYNS